MLLLFLFFYFHVVPLIVSVDGCVSVVAQFVSIWCLSFVCIVRDVLHFAHLFSGYGLH